MSQTVYMNIGNCNRYPVFCLVKRVCMGLFLLRTGTSEAYSCFISRTSSLVPLSIGGSTKPMCNTNDVFLIVLALRVTIRAKKHSTAKAKCCLNGFIDVHLRPVLLFTAPFLRLLILCSQNPKKQKIKRFLLFTNTVSRREVGRKRR